MGGMWRQGPSRCLEVEAKAICRGGNNGWMVSGGGGRKQCLEVEVDTIRPEVTYGGGDDILVMSGSSDDGERR